MKTTIKALVMVFTLSLFLLACNDDNNSSPGITTEESADDVSLTLSTDVTDLASNLTVVADDAENGRTASTGRVKTCGVSYDTAFARSYNGPFISYNYDVSYGYTLSCTGSGMPSSLAYTFSSDGQRSTARLSSTGKSTGSLTASGFEVTAKSYALNGSFSRTHTLTQKTGAQKVFNSESEVSLTGLSVNKSTQKIESGSALFTVTGQSSAGSSYEFTASVVFNGNGTATATIKSGVYLINLATGEVTKQS